MRLIDADELMEHVCRDKLDSRALKAYCCLKFVIPLLIKPLR